MRVMVAMGLSLALLGCEQVAESDASVGDASGPCARDEDCDDGAFCNGLERCLPMNSAADARGCVAASEEPCEGAAGCDETMDVCQEQCADDLDSDGFRAASCAGGNDCDDTDPRRYPGNVEICDDEGRDEDCDLRTFGTRDADGDGWIDARCCNTGGGGQPTCGPDCDDSRPDVHPTQDEACDGVDNDCDGAVDEGVSVMLWPDEDGDMFGDASATPVEGCPSAGYATSGGDCDDSSTSINPGATEVCDSADVDEDCDPSTVGGTDADRDGHVSSACCNYDGVELICGDDCDDTAATTYAGAPELCDRVDNDCSGAEDPGGADPYEDLDEDGHAPPDGRCEGGFPADDCEDQRPKIHPGAADGYSSCCSGIDNDCDGIVDEDPCTTCGGGRPPPCLPGNDLDTLCSHPRMCDLDADGYCAPEDCDDARPLANPARAEGCNGADDDCDGRIDEEVSCPPTSCVFRTDGSEPRLYCAGPLAWSEAGGACRAQGMALARIDDATENEEIRGFVDALGFSAADYWLGGRGIGSEVWRWPDDAIFWEAGSAVLYAAWGAGEPSANGSLIALPGGSWASADPAQTRGYVCELDRRPVHACDADGDGYCPMSGYRVPGPDCDDGDPGIHPLVEEVCDGVDQDCDGEVDELLSCP